MPVDSFTLRKSNVLKLNNPKYRPEETGKFVIVDEILDGSTSVFLPYDEENDVKNTFGQFNEYLEPIPLDAEILKKTGFTVDRTGAYMVINEFGNIYRLNCVNGEYQSTYNATPIKWLNQLQNHFSANTLLELTINL